MALIDIKAIEQEAQSEINKEVTAKAKNALVKKLRDLENARGIVRNIEAEISDLKASIADGSFVG